MLSTCLNFISQVPRKRLLQEVQPRRQTAVLFSAIPPRWLGALRSSWTRKIVCVGIAFSTAWFYSSPWGGGEATLYIPAFFSTESCPARSTRLSRLQAKGLRLTWSIPTHRYGFNLWYSLLCLSVCHRNLEKNIVPTSNLLTGRKLPLQITLSLLLYESWHADSQSLHGESF